jgi:uncharacterized membrane protein
VEELKKRSALKSLMWRIVGIIILATVTHCYTGNWITTGLVTIIHHAVFLIVFYCHERIWFNIKINSTMLRSLAKMLTYETVCGNIILGTITYLITGDARQMTAITLTYIGIKHIIYVWNEFLWINIKWGRNEN